jgi:RNA polymerase sigma factor (sigma-70 family)
MQTDLLTAEHSAVEPMPARELRPRLGHAAFADASDERLIALSRSGEQAAFEEIVQRHRPALLARCRRTLDADAAEDAVQLALVSAWRALADGCEVAHPRAWLHAIAHRSALQWIRAHPPEADATLELIACAEGPAEQIEQRLHTRATLAALAELPPAERDALLLAVVHGRSGRETARALGVSEGAVRQLVHRARAHLRTALAAPLAWPLPAGLCARWRARAGTDARIACAGARPALGSAPALARAAAVVAAGAIAGAPLALHAGAGHAATRAALGAPRHRATAARAVLRRTPPAASIVRRVRADRAAVATTPPARRERSRGVEPAAARGASGAVGSASTGVAAAAGAGSGAGTAREPGRRTGSAPGRPAGAPAGAGGDAGEAAGGGGTAPGGVVHQAAGTAGGVVSGVTHTAESVVGQVAGTVAAAAPVVGATVHGAGSTVAQTVGAAAEDVTRVVERVTAPPAQTAPEEGQKTLLGGLLGR